CVRQQAFPPGREEEEIRAFWKAAHQKVLLDESWLSTLLKQSSPPPTPVSVEESGGAEVGSAPTPAPTDSARALQPEQRLPSLEPVASRAPSGSGPRVEWGDWMCPASMGAKGNWPRSPNGWCGSTAGW